MPPTPIEGPIVIVVSGDFEVVELLNVVRDDYKSWVDERRGIARGIGVVNSQGANEILPFCGCVMRTNFWCGKEDVEFCESLKEGDLLYWNKDAKLCFISGESYPIAKLMWIDNDNGWIEFVWL